MPNPKPKKIGRPKLPKSEAKGRMRARPPGKHFRGHLCVHFRYGPMARQQIYRLVNDTAAEMLAHGEKRRSLCASS